MIEHLTSTRCAALAVLLFIAAPLAVAQAGKTPVVSGDYIIAVVNQDLVTASEVVQRLSRIRAEAQRTRSTLPPDDELRRQLVDALIDERVQLTYARESGPRIDDAELDRAVGNVAVQNQLTMEQLRERLQTEGMDFGRFRNNIRDQMVSERVREREVQARIRVTDEEIDKYLETRRAEVGVNAQYNIAQILVTLPDGANASVTEQRRARALGALARVQGGESFESVAKELSEDSNRAQGGVLGLRPADRLPDVFLEHVRSLKAGEVAATLLHTGAGFHVLKLVEKTEPGAFSVQQTRARHILLRPSAQLSEAAAKRRLIDFKRQIQAGTGFEALARANSEDGSAPQGGDLGWASPGTFVPEFEEAMNALTLGGISDPVVSRFGVHLIQVTERRQTTLDPKQQREQARNALREKKFEEAYTEWLRDLRARAYIEMREAPL
jgi:peptidyl-prolyl cis-trans isomerase SurA